MISSSKWTVNGHKLLTAVSLATGLFLCSCQQIKPVPTPSEQLSGKIEHREPTKPKPLTPPEQIKMLSDAVATEYRIGEGDVLNVTVWYRPELSNPEVLVAPDGVISIPRVGEIPVAGLTREEVAATIKKHVSKLYVDPEITVTVVRYSNNRIFVLGRVASPGIVYFPGPVTLVEAISRAGGIPGMEDDTFPAEISIIRGNDKLMWIDVGDLLHNGNMQLNARLQPNDIVFVPAIKQKLIYVMGEVAGPRALGLRGGVTLLDAIWQAGGPTDGANLKKTYLIRWDGKESSVIEIDLATMLSEGKLGEDILLKENDIIFLSRRGLAQWNYIMQQITPTFRMANLTDSTYIRFNGN